MHLRRRRRPTVRNFWWPALAVFLIPVFCLAAAAIADDADPKGKDKVADKSKKKDPQPADQDPPDDPPSPFPRHFRVQSLDGGNGWLNTSGEISIQDLRGKVVILDFWTYCCINCMHILPELKALEKKYPNQLVVIGVHSAKFENEKETENIRQAIMRYEIEHPVINDSDFTLWRKFFSNAWPTIGLIDPEGYYIGKISGEFQHERLDQAVLTPLIEYHRKKGTLDETPVKFQLEREKAKRTPLRYPGKVLADQSSGRLFISDSNHNRIVIAALDGKLIDIIGTGAMGAADGGYDTATFDHPQGMALNGDTLYVADTENHLIRKVDLKKKTVSTLAGTGEQARFRSAGGPIKDAALNSPWALSFIDGKLYIAMAGPHQMWVLDEQAGTVKTYAGSGFEDVTDGPLLEAKMAQPSGIATDGEYLYVVDSEASAVRKIDLNPDGEVTTLVGEAGGGLFRFGDVDGIGAEVKLQHPLGIAYQDGKLYVADSYNHRIKQIDIQMAECKTFLGTGKAGDAADPPQFSEPAGLSIAGTKLFIADTNNHKIRVANLSSGEVTDLTIAGLSAPKVTKPKPKAATPKNVIKLDPLSVHAEGSLPFEVALDLPEGYKLNPLAEVTYRISAEAEQTLIAKENLQARKEAAATGRAAKFEIPLLKNSGEAKLLITVTYQFCRDGAGGLCRIRTEHWSLPLSLKPNAENRAVKLKVEPRGKS